MYRIVKIDIIYLIIFLKKKSAILLLKLFIFYLFLFII